MKEEVWLSVDKQMEEERKVVNLSGREQNERYPCYSRQVSVNGTDKFEIPLSMWYPQMSVLSD
ncbi:MAG: hypothetical protein ACJ701_08970 [Nitrososphaera sp.]